MTKITLLTNIPAPYREKIHELVSQADELEYNVIYCAKKEANREWKIAFGNYRYDIIKESNKDGVHHNPSVLRLLRVYKPEVVVIMGFYPTMLYAWLWAVLNGRKIIVFTDGTLKSERSLSWMHKIVRKIVFSKTKAFIGPALGSKALYGSYNIKPQYFFRTYLCAANDKYYVTPFEEKTFDIMFSGQFIERKMPFFFIDVARELKNRLGDCKVLILGNGPLKDDILSKLNEYGIAYDYPGFVAQAELPNYYTKSKVFLFPTLNDPWGVVANEAMASGVPVITCPEAGVADDLVLNGVNGYIIKADVAFWAEKVIELLTNRIKYDQFVENSLKKVKEYNYENAASGIIDAIKSVS